MHDSQAGELTVEVCLRSSAPSVARGRQADVLDRVEALHERGDISGRTVTYWSTRVCSPGGGSTAVDSCPRVVGELLAAADRPGVSVEPYVRGRTSRGTSPGSDAGANGLRDADVLFLPVICLLVRRDGDLAGIYPLTVDGERYTVEDGLDRLERGDSAANLRATATPSN